MAMLLTGETYLRSVMDALPSPVFVVDADLWIHDANHAGKVLIGEGPENPSRRLYGDAMQCLHAMESSGGCGSSKACTCCAIREAGRAACAGEKVRRRMCSMQKKVDEVPHTSWLLISGGPLAGVEDKLGLVVLEDVTELVELRRLVPMCAHCRRVRDDDNYWQQVEEYLLSTTSMKFTHGLCPDCVRELYPELAEEVIRAAEKDRLSS